MARMSTGSSGYRSESYTTCTTETYSLEEAVDRACRGLLDLGEVFRQSPLPLQQEINKLAARQFSRDFSALTLPQQRSVMLVLKEEIRKAREGVSLVDALKMASCGELDELDLYQGLPDELRKLLDDLANTHGAADFRAANLAVRKQVIGVTLEMAEKSAADGARHRAEEAAKRLAQQEAIRVAQEEARRRAQEEARRRAEEEKRRQAEEAQRRARVQAVRRSRKQCTLCGESLGFANRLLGREKHHKCVVWKE